MIKLYIHVKYKSVPVAFAYAKKNLHQKMSSHASVDKKTFAWEKSENKTKVIISGGRSNNK